MAATLARRFLPTTASKILPTSGLSSFVSHSQQPSSRTLTSTNRNMAPNCNVFFEAVKARRTIYQLSNESTIPDSRIKEIVNDAMLHTPSSFNSQTTRMVVLLKEHHVKMWDVTTEIYKQQLPEEKFNHAKARFDGFRAAYGTVLLYEDQTKIHEFQTKFKSYEDKFPQWSEQTNGMMTYILWTAFEAEGLGCNLQHYNPLMDVRLQTEFNVPETWALKSQLVFGKPTGQPGEKQFDPVEERVKYFGL